MAMLRNMVTSLITFERIKTTHARAKAAQRMADRMISYAKRGDAFGKMRVAQFVKEKDARYKCNIHLAERYKYRHGGYTRVIKLKNRVGDNAEVSVLEFVDRGKEEMRPAALVDRVYHVQRRAVENTQSQLQKHFRW